VLQGTGVEQPSKTYPAVIARRLNLDFVNLGFGGSGRAEPEVVALVNRPAASGFLFDLGKSYGDQTPAPFARMLADIRATHPTAPIFCVTPIYSTKEATEPGYLEKSERLRTLMRDAAVARRDAGDRHIFVVEGLELFGPADKDLFRDPLHPNDAGNERMAGRLVGRVQAQVLKPKQP
jgi:lysophospholipase L1-like esterase